MFFTCKNGKKKIFSVVVFFSIFIIISCDEIGDNNFFSKNLTCSKIQENEFPSDLFTKKQRKFGAIILHIILFLYSFGAITVICEEYFLPTIKCFCEDLKLSDDVAAATFMSIATSTPELFTNIIGTFITESDIGLGHVIGNGYFDMFFVSALGGLVAKQDLILEWWPLARDCAIYFLIAVTLTGVVWDGIIQIHETIVLLFLYVIYFIVMFNNERLMEIISKKIRINKHNSQNSSTKDVELYVDDIEKQNSDLQEKKEIQQNDEEDEPFDTEQSLTLSALPIETPKKVDNKLWIITKKIFYIPLRTLSSYTVPDVRLNTRRKYYPLSFLLCVAWIGFATYLGTWMISVIGDTLGIPDLLMGMVFMAAGGSVVEAYSVYYMTRRGKCNIGLSNSMGCNNLDATLCLSLPWLLKILISSPQTGCPQRSSNIFLQSSHIHINCLLLVISVLGLFYIFYSNKFKLNKRSGILCGAVYVLVITIAISIESYANE